MNANQTMLTAMQAVYTSNLDVEIKKTLRAGVLALHEKSLEVCANRCLRDGYPLSVVEMFIDTEDREFHQGFEKLHQQYDPRPEPTDFQETEFT